MATASKAAAHVRWLIRRDMGQMLGISDASFDNGWTEDYFLNAMRQRNVFGQVAECNDRILGYVLYVLHQRSLHILNLAVHPDCRKQGVGRQLLDKLTSKLRPEYRTRVTVDVPESNLGCHLFLRSCGFRAAKVLRGYFDETSEDGYRFVYTL